MKPDNNSLVYVVDPKDNYVYLREVLTNRWQLSRSLQVRLKAQNKIKVNGQVTRTNYRLQPGDIVTVGIDLEETSDITPLYAPLDIIYEDPDCLVVNKPPGMAVHSPRGDRDNLQCRNLLLGPPGKRLFRPVALTKTPPPVPIAGQFHHQAMYRQQKAHHHPQVPGKG